MTEIIIIAGAVIIVVGFIAWVALLAGRAEQHRARADRLQAEIAESHHREMKRKLINEELDQGEKDIDTISDDGWFPGGLLPPDNQG